MPLIEIVIHTISHSAPSFCVDCQQRFCQSCGRRSEAVALPAGLAPPTLTAPSQQLQLPAPPSRASSQISMARSHARSHRSDQTLLSDDSEISHRSARSNRSDRTALTAANLRRSATVSRSRRSEPSRTERFVQGQLLAIMPPPPPSQVSSSSYRPSSTRRDEPAPSQVSRASTRRSSSRRGSSEYPPPSLTFHSSSRRPDRYQGSSRDHNRRSSYSSSDSGDTIR